MCDSPTFSVLALKFLIASSMSLDDPGLSVKFPIESFFTGFRAHMLFVPYYKCHRKE